MPRSHVSKFARSGVETVSAGGFVGFDQVNSGGSVVVLAGGTAGRGSNVEFVNAGAVEIVSSGGSAASTWLKGSMTVLTGGFANDLLVSSGGNADFPRHRSARLYPQWRDDDHLFRQLHIQCHG